MVFYVRRASFSRARNTLFPLRRHIVDGKFQYADVKTHIDDRTDFNSTISRGEVKKLRSSRKPIIVPNLAP